MEWIIFSLAAAIIWSFVNIIDKFTFSKLINQPILPVMMFGILGLLTSISVFIVKGLTILSVSDFILAFTAAGLYILMLFLYFMAVKREEISRLIPLYYLTPAFILLIAIPTLNEIFTALQYVGIALLVVGAILITANPSATLKFNRAMAFMVLAAFAYALNQVLLKYLLIHNDFWQVFAYTRLSVFIILVPIILIIYIKKKSIFKASPRAYILISFNQGLNLAGILAITIALSNGYVTLVNALTSLQPFFVLVLATILSFFYPHIIQEKLGYSIFVFKFLAIMMMFAGALLVT